MSTPTQLRLPAALQPAPPDHIVRDAVVPHDTMYMLSLLLELSRVVNRYVAHLFKRWLLLIQCPLVRHHRLARMSARMVAGVEVLRT